MTKTTKIIIIVAVIVVIAIIAFVLYKKNKENKEKKEKEDQWKDMTPTDGGYVGPDTKSDVEKGLNLGGDILKDVADSGLV